MRPFITTWKKRAAHDVEEAGGEVEEVVGGVWGESDRRSAAVLSIPRREISVTGLVRTNEAPRAIYSS